MHGEAISRSRFLASALGSALLPAVRAGQVSRTPPEDRILSPPVGRPASGSGEGLDLRLRDDRLFVSAPGLDLLRGPVLDRLKNGITVPFDFHLALWAGSRSQLRRRAFERFIVSYDLWEERFAVTGLRNPRPSASNLTAAAVPAWCLDHVPLHPVELPSDIQVWVRLDVRAGDPKDNDPALLDETGLSLRYLIDLLSRPSPKEPNRWTLETGPVRFASISR